ncbi:spore germination protein KA/spore germination protein [Melghirimyces profundicolus]|uniref:Spore germination protein KA/spore germination protein n=2 Tax=Melghirimyces profundicolus TaxID=1242148 RepID=A0A2T6BYT1_9BACL|nr:spore germination protein KA/spore germination protein [Melghirimyces profundicolus]
MKMKRKRAAGRGRRKKEILEKNGREKTEKKTLDIKVQPELETNTEFIGKLLGDSTDVVTRHFTIQYAPDRKAAVIYLDGMSDSKAIDLYVLKPLMLDAEKIRTKTDLWHMVDQSLVQVGETKVTEKMRDMVDSLLSGDALLFVDGYAEGMVINARGWKQRGIDTPRSENTVRGSREGFTETLRVNTALIRRRLKDPDLRLKDLKVGERTKTNVAILFIEGVADEKLVKEMQNRIEKIKLDGVLESGYIEEMIQDNTWSPFPTLQNTERPDSAVAHLLEGKVVVVVDGTPHVLVAPAIFAQFYFSPEDYFERYLIATFLRVLRLLAFFIALSLPALYIAFIGFHPEMIPSDLAIAMAAGRSTVPFPSIVEALVMETSVEILREASIRLPGPIGPTIGIVGALVIGEAAVSAGLVSPLMVIVVGLTTISSYGNPSYNAAISVRMLRFPLMIAASILGLYGIMLFLMLLLLHLIKLESFGVPYLAPFSPLRLSDVKDSLIRIPWPWMKKRPVIFRPEDEKREEVEGKVVAEGNQ